MHILTDGFTAALLALGTHANSMSINRHFAGISYADYKKLCCQGTLTESSIGHADVGHCLQAGLCCSLPDPACWQHMPENAKSH